MNIIKFDYNKLSKSIDEYILNNNTEDIYLCKDSYIKVNKPIILMNSETLKIIEKEAQIYVYSYTKKEKIPMINGCYIAIAEWLLFGDVELK